ncbi:MAG: SUF system Fe-S cluster assembly protein [Bacteroidales bacterium]|nr:SUF system Fe-S cluster assembly protein [Bacteroidales bacterium]
MEEKIKKMDIENGVVEQLKQVYDPEIPVNIYDLGLVYEVNIDDDSNVHILMTLTAPNCPVAESLPQEVKEKAAEVEGVNSADVEITFDPPWTMDMMSEEAKMELGFI